jgi:hypothetical protein
MKRWDQARAASERRPHVRTVFAPVAGLVVLTPQPEPRLVVPPDPLRTDVENNRLCFQAKRERAYAEIERVVAFYQGWWSYRSAMEHTATGARVQWRSDYLWNWFRNLALCHTPCTTIEEAMVLALGYTLVETSTGVLVQGWRCRGWRRTFWSTATWPTAVEAARAALEWTRCG